MVLSFLTCPPDQIIWEKCQHQCLLNCKFYTFVPRSADIFYFNKNVYFKFILKFRHLKFFVQASTFNEETVMLQITEKRFFKCLF